MSAGDGTQVLVLCNKHFTNGASPQPSIEDWLFILQLDPSTLFQAALEGLTCSSSLGWGVKSQIPTFSAFPFFTRLPLSAEGGDKSSHGSLAPLQPQWGCGMMATIGSPKLLRQGRVGLKSQIWLSWRNKQAKSWSQGYELRVGPSWLQC